jgi:hypothetical protein
LGITKNRSGSTPPVSKAVAQSIERNNLQMGPTDLNSTTTAGTQIASAVSQTSPTATQASTSANANLKQAANAAAANSKQMLVLLEKIQSKECLVLESVHEIKAEQLELKQTLALIIEKIDLLRTSPPQPPPPRSRHFNDVF